MIVMSRRNSRMVRFVLFTGELYMRLFQLLGVLFCLLLATAAQATTTYKLGSKTVTIKVTTMGAGGQLYFAPHDNENTAVAEALAVMRSKGGKLVELSHGGTRNISFTFEGKSCSVDPNRIFTSAGIIKTLGKCPAGARPLVAGLAKAILAQLRGRLIVAIHNNSGGGYSVMSYKKGDRNTADVYVNPNESRGEFFLTTNRKVFENARTNGYNVVLQSRSPVDDGSLSVYAAHAGMAYINVEAGNGHGAHQRQMLSDLW